MNKFWIAGLLTLLVSVPALADNTGRYYIGADYGSSSYSNLPGWTNPNVSRISGGYYFSPFAALELGYSIFGDSNGYVSGQYGTISTSSFQVAAVANLPLAPQFGLIGKLGLASNYEDESYVNGFRATHSQSDLFFSFGAQINLDSQFNLHALYDYYGKFDNYYYPLRASSLSVGLGYIF